MDTILTTSLSLARFCLPHSSAALCELLTTRPTFSGQTHTEGALRPQKGGVLPLTISAGVFSSGANPSYDKGDVGV